VICTTLNEIREHGPCPEGWQKLLLHLGKTQADDEPLPLLTVLDSNGLDDALWCLRAVPEHNALWRHYAVDCAERVAHLLTDDRSREALRVARRHALGEATDEELAAAWDAAYAAWDHPWAASSALCAAALGTIHIAAVTSGVLWATSRDARVAEQEWQAARLRKLLTDGAWSPVGEV
jgi:hypothetical protein